MLLGKISKFICTFLKSFVEKGKKEDLSLESSALFVASFSSQCWLISFQVEQTREQKQQEKKKYISGEKKLVLFFIENFCSIFLPFSRTLATTTVTKQQVSKKAWVYSFVFSVSPPSFYHLLPLLQLPIFSCKNKLFALYTFQAAASAHAASSVRNRWSSRSSYLRILRYFTTV